MENTFCLKFSTKIPSKQHQHHCSYFLSWSQLPHLHHHDHNPLHIYFMCRSKHVEFGHCSNNGTLRRWDTRNISSLKIHICSLVFDSVMFKLLIVLLSLCLNQFSFSVLVMLHFRGAETDNQRQNELFKSVSHHKDGDGGSTVKLHSKQLFLRCNSVLSEMNQRQAD